MDYYIIPMKDVFGVDRYGVFPASDDDGDWVFMGRNQRRRCMKTWKHIKLNKDLIDGN